MHNQQRLCIIPWSWEKSSEWPASTEQAFTELKTAFQASRSGIPRRLQTISCRDLWFWKLCRSYSFAEGKHGTLQQVYDASTTMNEAENQFYDWNGSSRCYSCTKEVHEVSIVNNRACLISNKQSLWLALTNECEHCRLTPWLASIAEYNVTFRYRRS